MTRYLRTGYRKVVLPVRELLLPVGARVSYIPGWRYFN